VRSARPRASARLRVGLPSGALTFGNRNELIEVARERLYAKGSPYIRHIYGENEVAAPAGCTSRTSRSRSWSADRRRHLRVFVPDSGFLAAVPFVLTLWPPLLMGIYSFSKRRNEVGAHGSDPREEADHV